MVWRGLIKPVAQITIHPYVISLYRVAVNRLMPSRADEEISTTDVKLELEQEPQEALLKSPNLTLHCALCSPVHGQPCPSLY